MDWQETRRAARATVQSTFGVGAEYLPVSGGSPVSVRVRVHTRASQGSIAYARREGYGEVADAPTRVITDRPGVARGDIFQVQAFIRDDGTTGPAALRVDHVLPTEGDGLWTCLVAEVRS